MTRNERQLTFLEELHEQRWDDHRYYHQSRINQSLHLVSALSFLAAYVLVPFSPIAAAFLGWFVAMLTRQSGHFFFEPKGYDEVNHATHDYKEEIKVGYNLQRKIVLLSAWALCPLLLWISPTFFGVFEPHVDGFLHNLSKLWLSLAAIAVVLRVAWLAVTQNSQTGLVWATKILTDPFHDVKVYYKAPLYVLRGDLLDPMTDWPTRRA